MESKAVAVFVIVAFLVGFGIAWIAKPAPSPMKKITFGLDWVVYGRHAPFYVAKEKGYYQDAGLSVDIVRGYGSADAVQKVDTGTVDFSFGDLGSLAKARAKGAKVKCVAMIYYEAPYTIYTMPGSGITEPEDLEGHTISAISEGDSNYVLFPALADAAGFNAEKVHWTFMAPELKVPALLQGKVDAITEYYFATPSIQKEEPDVNIIRYSDYGLNIYSNGILARDEMIQNDPSTVRKFVQATLKGYEWGLNHPDEATKILLKYQPHLNEEIAKEEMDVIRDMVMTSEMQEHGLGWASEDKVADTRDVYFDVYDITENIPVEDIYTSQFLPS